MKLSKFFETHMPEITSAFITEPIEATLVRNPKGNNFVLIDDDKILWFGKFDHERQHAEFEKDNYARGNELKMKPYKCDGKLLCYEVRWIYKLIRNYDIKERMTEKITKAIFNC